MTESNSNIKCSYYTSRCQNIVIYDTRNLHFVYNTKGLMKRRLHCHTLPDLRHTKKQPNMKYKSGFQET